MARIRELLRSDLDWERLLMLATRHRMLPLLWWHLKTEKQALPEPCVELLQRAFLANATQMLRLSAELLELSRLFAGRGIAMVPYKGPALGAYLYENVALRHAGDLDLLVRRADVGRARAILLDRGYRPRHALSRGGEQFMLRSRYSEELDRVDGLSVELHWAFTNGDVRLPLDLDVLAPRLRTMQLGGGVLPMFGREDLLVILCVHGSKHRWDRLEWLCGIAELLRAHALDLDWRVVVDRAGALGVRRMLLLGVLLAHDLLGASVPELFLQLARSDGTVSRLAAEVPKLFVSDAVAEDASSLATDLFRLRLRERPRDRLRFIWYRLTTPSRPESWSAISVGRHSLPLHSLLRPFRIFARLVPALRQHLRTTRVRS